MSVFILDGWGGRVSDKHIRITQICCVTFYHGMLSLCDFIVFTEKEVHVEHVHLWRKTYQKLSISLKWQCYPSFLVDGFHVLNRLLQVFQVQFNHLPLQTPIQQVLHLELQLPLHHLHHQLQAYRNTVTISKVNLGG